MIKKVNVLLSPKSFDMTLSKWLKKWMFYSPKVFWYEFIKMIKKSECFTPPKVFWYEFIKMIKKVNVLLLPKSFDMSLSKWLKKWMLYSPQSLLIWVIHILKFKCRSDTIIILYVVGTCILVLCGQKPVNLPRA